MQRIKKYKNKLGKINKATSSGSSIPGMTKHEHENCKRLGREVMQAKNNGTKRDWDSTYSQWNASCSLMALANKLPSVNGVPSNPLAWANAR